MLLSWNAKPAAKNYRVQISQRADFQGTVEQVDTDNTSYAPTLLSPTYLAGGTFWWRVAAQDEDRNIGDFSLGQQFSLAKQSGGTVALTRLKLATKLVRATNGRRVTVTVKANGRPARGVLVRVFARGVTPLKAKTNRYGRVTFRIKKLGRGKRLVLRKLASTPPRRASCPRAAASPSGTSRRRPRPAHAAAPQVALCPGR